MDTLYSTPSTKWYFGSPQWVRIERCIYYHDFCELCGKGQCLRLRRPGDHLHFTASYEDQYLCSRDWQVGHKKSIFSTIL